MDKDKIKELLNDIIENNYEIFFKTMLEKEKGITDNKLLDLIYELHLESNAGSFLDEDMENLIYNASNMIELSANSESYPKLERVVIECINDFGGTVKIEDLEKLYSRNKIDLFSTTVDGEKVDYSVDLENYNIVYYVENNAVALIPFESAEELTEHIQNLDYNNVAFMDLEKYSINNYSDEVISKIYDPLEFDTDLDGLIDRFDVDFKDSKVRSYGELSQKEEKIKIIEEDVKEKDKHTRKNGIEI